LTLKKWYLSSLLHHQDAISHEQKLSTILFTSTCWKMKLEIYMCVCVFIYIYIYIILFIIIIILKYLLEDRYQNGHALSLESLNKMPR
jgi:hypothetical protein